ncbi:hypothetical protein VQ044_24920 [Aurantimonas sp. C2-5-R2]|uniref:hypothetical protein n=1 Tax=Aurantimonas sp. C2-5-R2 TaxID=3113713 RepID=UPI002F938C72
MKRMIAIAALAAVSGCAGLSRSMEYADVTSAYQAMPDDTYKIFDKPSEGRMLISTSLGKAMATGAGACQRM